VYWAADFTKAKMEACKSALFSLNLALASHHQKLADKYTTLAETYR
jgi:hypothetical protein